MFIESLSEFIYIDQIKYQHNNSQDKNYIHFFSRPDAGFNVPDDWNSIIYTSQDIFDILQHRENPIDKRYFRILFYNETIIIKTQDKLIFEVIMINTESFSKNVMFLFTIKDKKQSILYTGNLANYDKIIDRKCFHAIQNKVITELYMDKTLAENASFLNDLDTVCCDLAKLIKSSPDYKFNIMLPLIGYEDFLATLSIKYKIRIMINSLRYYVFSKSNIEKHFLTYNNNNLINNCNNNNNNRINNINYELFIECNKFLSLEEIKQRFYENKIITLQFMIRNKNITIDKSFETCGIYQVNWGPHPTFGQMSLFMKQFNINSINPITDYTLHKYEIKKFNNVNNNNNNNYIKVNDNDEVVLISVQQQSSNNNNNNNQQQLQQLGNFDMNQQQLQLHFQLRQQQQQQFLLQNQQQQQQHQNSNNNNNNNTNQLQIIKPLNFFLNKINNEIISISSDDDSNIINNLNSNSNTQNGVDLVNNNSCNNNINNNNHNNINNNDDDDDDTNNTNTMYVHLPKRQRTSNNNNNNKKSINNKMINNNNNQTSSSSAFGGTTTTAATTPTTTAVQPLNFSNYNTNNNNNKQIIGTSMTALPQSMMGGGGGGDATQSSSSGIVGLTKTPQTTITPTTTLNGLIKAEKLNDNSVIL